MNSSRPIVALVALASFTSTTTSAFPGRSGGAKTPDPPLNVVLIVADDVGVDQIGCYESLYPDRNGSVNRPRPCTPNLDALAAGGVRFTNCWSSPLCSLTRAQLMTGKRARFTGIGSVTTPSNPSQNGLQVGEPTEPEFFDLDAALGKWHLADESQIPSHPLDLGFTYFRGVWYNLAPPPQDGPAYDYWWQYDSGTGLSTHQTTYATAKTTEDALEFLEDFEADPQERTWFLYVAYNASHGPYHCPHEAGYTLSGAGACTGGTNWYDICCTEQCPVEPPMPWPGNVAQTRAMTQVLDHEIGLLLDAIDPATTAVIFVADNGTPANATVLPWDPPHGKGTLYQGGVNVPLIARIPGQGPAVPQECHELVSVADIHYTLADLAGVVVAPEPGQEGPHSLTQYTNSAYDLNDSTPRTHVWSERFARNFVPDPDGTPPAGYLTETHDRAVRSLTHKLIEWQDGITVTRELYRLYDDTFPVPQDPALIPDPYEQDPLDIADLDPVDQVAYDELAALLDAEGPLPLWLEYTNTAEFVREAASITTGFGQQLQCTGKPIHVLFDDGPQPRRERAFLDFDVSAPVLDGAEILGVDLAVAVRVGGDGDTQVEVRAMPQPGQDYTGFGNCLQLFGSIASMPTYAVEDGWNVSAAHKRFDLGSAAADDLATIAASSDPTFPVGLKLLHEEAAFEDTIELYDIAGALPHRIYVRYRPAP